MKNKFISDCCLADVETIGSDEGTSYWRCTSCEKACSVIERKFKPYDEKYFDKLFKDKEKTEKLEYPNIKPPLDFEEYGYWEEAGIERKLEIVRECLSDIYKHLNEKNEKQTKNNL